MTQREALRAVLTRELVVAGVPDAFLGRVVEHLTGEAFDQVFAAFFTPERVAVQAERVVLEGFDQDK